MTQTSRTSRGDLGYLSSRLSERDWQIIRFVDRHRFATSSQIRRVFFAGHATQTAATRACIRVLDRLLTLRILTRLERRVGGNRHGSAGFVWCLDVVGERLTRMDGAPRRRFHEPSYVFLSHTLALTDTHVMLREAQGAGEFVLSQIEIETEAWRPYLTPAGVKSMLKPDLKITIANGDYEDHWYIEIDLATESMPMLVRKCRAYEDYRHTGRAQAEYGVFPRVLWVMPTQARLSRSRDAITAEKGLSERLFVFSTPDKLITTLRDPP